MENLMKPIRQEQEVQELDEDIIINEWRQVLTLTYPFPPPCMPSLNHPFPTSPYFASLHHKPPTPHLHQLINSTYYLKSLLWINGIIMGRELSYDNENIDDNYIDMI
jgi:hypothetical protein